MKKFVKVVCIILAIVGVAIGGLKVFEKIKGPNVDTPILEIDTNAKTLYWQWDTDATKYNLYDNNTLLDTFTLTEELVDGMYQVEFLEYLTEYKEYNFKIEAYIDEKTKKESKAVIYLYQDPNIETTTSYGIVVNNSTLAPKNLVYDNYTLKWDSVADATKYYVCAIDKDCEVTSFDTTETEVSVFNYLSQNITAFRVGASFGEIETYFGDMITINISNIEDVYKQIYYFNGGFHDYYIESSQEFISALYYSFIAKDETIHIKFSPSALIEIMGSETGVTKEVVQDYISAITETCYYSFDYLDYTKYKYKFTFDYKGVTEPSEDSSNVETKYFTDFEVEGLSGKYSGNVTQTLSQSEALLPYYVNYTFSSRDDSYDNFASDKNIVIVNCESSEELYWAVEGGATPVFSGNTSTAYKLYNTAKDILVENISNSMTTYERILSIYDYIAYSSIYDYKALSMSTASGNNSTIYKAFYLESILNTKDTRIAVCDGYSKTFSLLCNMEGIECYRVVGVAQTSTTLGSHAWNKVKLNDKWYVVDITWTEYTLSDAVKKTSNVFTQDTYEVLGHRYFMVSDSYVENDHFAYNNEDDRVRFKFVYNTAKYNSFFPAVYLNGRTYASEQAYSYYTNTALGTIDRYIENYDEAQEFLEYVRYNDVTNIEIIVGDLSKTGTTHNQALSSFISHLSSNIYGGFAVYRITDEDKSEVYVTDTDTITGQIFILTSLPNK